MIAVKATSKKNPDFFWLSTWMQSWKRAEAVREEVEEVFGEEWDVEIVSQYPGEKEE